MRRAPCYFVGVIENEGAVILMNSCKSRIHTSGFGRDAYHLNDIRSPNTSAGLPGADLRKSVLIQDRPRLVVCRCRDLDMDHGRALLSVVGCEGIGNPIDVDDGRVGKVGRDQGPQNRSEGIR